MPDAPRSLYVIPADPAATPYLRLIYAAWSDGELTDDEIRSVQTHIASAKGLSDAARTDLQSWLQPNRPPSIESLQTLLKPMSGDLASVTEPRPTVEPPVSTASASFSVAALQEVTAGKRAATRRRVFEILSGPGFERHWERSKEAHREQVLEQLKVLAADGIGSLSYPEEYGGSDDMGRFAVAFETTAFYDISLTIKFGVQFGLFGGTIHALGTKRHHDRYLRQAGTVELTGCFAMTELGHGSNVADIETTATYDPASGEFEIDTPSDSAQKNYIGNAAVHGRLAVVFAQLVVGGEVQGVHALLVPIRDEAGATMPGVRIEDCGQKLGLNGVDNGRIWFDHVRVPRENLFNRYADVSPEGEYVSPIESPSKRFFTTIGALVAGRVSVALGALSAMKSGLAIAVRYGDRRRQFGASGAPETRLLDYRTHQRKLLPRLASAYALDFALKHLVDRFVNRNEEEQREIETLAAGLKAYATWANIESLQVCREACGGQGYLSENRFDDLKADTDIFCTFEGDNTVLMQLVVKSLLSDYRRQFEDARPFTLLKYVAARAADAVREPHPLAARNTDADHLRDAEFHLDAFRYREQRLLGSLARRLKHRLDQGMDSFYALVDVQDHVLAAANAHAERIVMEQFVAGVAGCVDPAVQTALGKLSALFALSRIEVDRGWFLEAGYVSTAKSHAIREQVNVLCAEIRPDAVGLADGFGIPDRLLGAPIAMP
ncbi:MAG: acyl-CoA dehydrogenase [Acidobacteria bacterium]|nr:acyl-CoA dehydrogenase [Acidobacteriota bacterium]MDA1236344.1 acyl-CoA dehydrogenase [Acidobacteriota bacterium]